MFVANSRAAIKKVKKKYIYDIYMIMIRKKGKWNHTECSIKTIKGQKKKKVEDKTRSKKQEQDIENSNEYGRY